MLLFKPDLLSVQIPLLFVTQLAVPLAPLLHLPLTVALAIGFSAALCTRMVTVVFQPLLVVVDEESRSPIWIVVAV